MKYLILVVFLLSLNVDAGFYVGLGIGKNGIRSSNQWEGSSSTACMAEIGYSHRFKSFELNGSWMHFSQCTRGDGLGHRFDSRPEDGLDNAGVWLRYHF